MTFNKPHLPHVSPSTNHQTTTFTTHFSQNPNKNAPSTTNKKTPKKERLAKAKPPFLIRVFRENPRSQITYTEA